MTADAHGTPAAEIHIDASLIRALLTAQLPHLAQHKIQIVEAGWDNVMARVGGDLAVRLPRRAAAEPLLKSEQKWLPLLAPQLPVAIPVPLFCGVPNAVYPFAWSLQNWLPGQAADLAPPSDDQTTVLCNFLGFASTADTKSCAGKSRSRLCVIGERPRYCIADGVVIG